jgi:ABC-2 type transport system ATP-binding protein
MNNRKIKIEELLKRYPGDVTALVGLSFGVDGGSVFGFHGPNGPGKSTAIKILTTLALPTEGGATVGGHDVVCDADQVRRIAGVARRVGACRKQHPVPVGVGRTPRKA